MEEIEQMKTEYKSANIKAAIVEYEKGKRRIRTTGTSKW
jgi:hypothetical protein